MKHFCFYAGGIEFSISSPGVNAFNYLNYKIFILITRKLDGYDVCYNSYNQIQFGLIHYGSCYSKSTETKKML